MALSWPFARHAGWQKQLDAYVDGELSPAAARKFELHAGACSRCTGEMTARRELKRMVASLPELPAPRSFRITPGMLVEAPGARTSRARPVVMRLAQVTAGLATVAFGAVLAVDLSQSDDRGTRQEASGGSATETFGTASEPSAPTPAAVESQYLEEDADLAGDDDSGELPPVDGAVEGQSVATPSPAAPNEEMNDEANKTDSAKRQGESAITAGEASPDGPASSIPLAVAEADNEGLSGYVVAEIALVALALAAGMTWLLTRRPRASRETGG